MIPNQWYVVMDSDQIKDKPVGVTRMGEKLVFWCDDAGRVSCLRDKCVHRGVALSKGEVVHGRLQCPFHGFEYDTSGKVQVIPANGRQAPVADRFHVFGYPTHEAHGFVWIWWGEAPPETLAPPRFFDDLDDEDLGLRSVGRPLLPRDRKSTRCGAFALRPSQHHRARWSHRRRWPRHSVGG